LPWPRRTLISSGKGFGGKSGVQTKSKEAEMIDDIRATLIERPREEALHFNLGLLLLSSSPGRPPDDGVKREALMAFQNSVMLNPKRTGAWYNLAVLSDEFGEVDKAVEAYEKVLSLTSTTGKWKDNEDEGGPLRVACHSNKISLLIHQGKLDEAAKASDAAVKEYPDDASLWCGMGVVLRMDSNVEWATKAFETALSCCKEEGKQNSRQGQEESLLVALNNLGALYASTVTAAETVTQAAEAANKAVRMYVFCSMCFLPFLVCDVSVSILSIYCYQLAFSGTTLHESNHHPPLPQSIIINRNNTHITNYLTGTRGLWSCSQPTCRHSTDWGC
jgi:tetratricopeptide (TPR) repeat protein